MKSFVEIEGFKCYAPNLAFENDGFPSQVHDLLASLEEKNFWFKSRNEIIQELFKKFLGYNNNKKVLEIGCGNGFVLKGLQSLKYQLYGSEIYLEGLKNVSKRISNVELFQIDATDMPFQEEFDAIGAFDVIEHIDDDKKVMREIHKSLKSDGLLYITVPQYQWMWSYMDDYAKHKRRYKRTELKQKLQDTGFDVMFISSFVTILFPFVMLSRIMKKNKPIEEVTIDDVTKELILPSWLNKLFYQIMQIDRFLIKKEFSLPFGNSLVVVAKKTF